MNSFNSQIGRFYYVESGLRTFYQFSLLLCVALWEIIQPIYIQSLNMFALIVALVMLDMLHMHIVKHHCIRIRILQKDLLVYRYQSIHRSDIRWIMRLCTLLGWQAPIIIPKAVFRHFRAAGICFAKERDLIRYMIHAILNQEVEFPSQLIESYVQMPDKTRLNWTNFKYQNDCKIFAQKYTLLLAEYIKHQDKYINHFTPAEKKALQHLNFLKQLPRTSLIFQLFDHRLWHNQHSQHDDQNNMQIFQELIDLWILNNTAKLINCALILKKYQRALFVKSDFALNYS